MELTEEQRTAYAYALTDIRNGCTTLWVNRLKEERPELYEYAMKQRRHQT